MSGDVETPVFSDDGETASAAAVSSGIFGTVTVEASSPGAGAEFPPDGRGVGLRAGRGATLVLIGGATCDGGWRLAETWGAGCGWLVAHDESTTIIGPSRAVKTGDDRCSRRTSPDTMRLATAT